jgi:hypothetical protein
MASDCAGSLEFTELRDAARVPCFAAERCGDESVDERYGFVDGVLAGANRDQIRIIVLARELGGRDIPDKGRAGAGYLVRCNLFAIARTTENDAESLDACRLVANYCACGIDAEAGIVIERFIARRTVVDHFVTVVPKVLLKVFAELEAGVIGRDVDAHAFSL